MNSSQHAASRALIPATQQALLQLAPGNIKTAQESLISAIKTQDETHFDAVLDIALSEGASLDTLDGCGLIPLEIAVLHNKPRIVQSLLSRGSSLPLVHSNGFDLAMLAASKGHTATLMVLLDVGAMVPDAQDDCGATALHYAVINDHLQAAVALLDREADSDLVMTSDIDPAIRREVGIPDSVGKAGTTALMLAVAMGNRPMTELLLSRGASCLSGARHPFELAILNDDVPMIDLLLEKNLDPNKILRKDGKSLLTFSIENYCSLALIKKLHTPNVETQASPNTLKVPLQTAIQTGQHDVVSYLLSQGVKIESDTTLSTSMWRLAENLNDQGKMLNILIASQADHAESTFKDGGISLSFLCQFALQPSVISAHGIFPEAITPALPTLQSIQSRSHELSLAQIKLEVAHCLYRLKPREGNPATTSLSSAESTLNEVNEDASANDISRKINAQIKELRETGRKMLAEKVNYLSRVVSRDFFNHMFDICIDRENLAAFIQQRLTSEDGFPKATAELIATAWVTSYEKAKQESLLHATNNMLLQRTENQAMLILENMLLKKIEEDQIIRGGQSFCISALFSIVTKRHTPMHQFIIDPVAFLRLLPPPPGGKKLTEQQFVGLLCSLLGLPSPLCRQIHRAWESASNEANIAVPSGHAGRVYDWLSKAMAASLKLMLHGPRNHRQDGDIVMPLRLQGRLLQWCNTILAQQDEDGTDANDQEPPAKRARFS